MTYAGEQDRQCSLFKKFLSYIIYNSLIIYFLPLLPKPPKKILGE